MSPSLVASTIPGPPYPRTDLRAGVAGARRLDTARSASIWVAEGASAVGAWSGAGAMKPDWAVHLENAALALLVGVVLLGVPALARLLGLG